MRSFCLSRSGTSWRKSTKSHANADAHQWDDHIRTWGWVFANEFCNKDYPSWSRTRGAGRFRQPKMPSRHPAPWTELLKITGQSCGCQVLMPRWWLSLAKRMKEAHVHVFACVSVCVCVSVCLRVCVSVCLCVCVSVFALCPAFLPNRGARIWASTSECKIDQTDFAYWMSLVPSNLMEGISPNLEALSPNT